jgi:hypothetical protein
MDLCKACVLPNNAGLANASRLLSAGANVDFEDPGTEVTPLMLAAANGNVLVCDLLLKRGADVNQRSAMADAGTAIDGAMTCGHLQVGCASQAACSPPVTGVRLLPAPTRPLACLPTLLHFS